MNKDIEWANGEIEKLRDLLNNKRYEEEVDDFTTGVLSGLKKALNILDQLDEPETLSAYWIEQKSIDTHVDALSGEVEMTYRLNDLENLLLPEQEVLSQEWIDKYAQGDYDEWVYTEDLQNILVPKQEVTEEHGMSESEWAEVINRYKWHLKQEGYVVIEKPTVPRFIAEAIEEDKEAGCDVYDSIYLIIETNGGGVPSISDWVAKNIDKYARAWINGYTVEEQKYYVLDEGNIPFLAISNGEVNREPMHMTIYAKGRDNAQFALTEQEIKDYDPRYMTFAKPIEEFEE